MRFRPFCGGPPACVAIAIALTGLPRGPLTPRIEWRRTVRRVRVDRRGRRGWRAGPACRRRPAQSPKGTRGRAFPEGRQFVCLSVCLFVRLFVCLKSLLGLFVRLFLWLTGPVPPSGTPVRRFPSALHRLRHLARRRNRVRCVAWLSGVHRLRHCSSVAPCARHRRTALCAHDRQAALNVLSPLLARLKDLTDYVRAGRGEPHGIPLSMVSHLACAAQRLDRLCARRTG